MSLLLRPPRMVVMQIAASPVENWQPKSAGTHGDHDHPPPLLLADEKLSAPGLRPKHHRAGDEEETTSGTDQVAGEKGERHGDGVPSSQRR